VKAWTVSSVTDFAAASALQQFCTESGSGTEHIHQVRNLSREDCLTHSLEPSGHYGTEAYPPPLFSSRPDDYDSQLPVTSYRSLPNLGTDNQLTEGLLCKGHDRDRISALGHCDRCTGLFQSFEHRRCYIRELPFRPSCAPSRSLT
jgi:hypothetical protein